jgi:hypothetical protein
VEARAPHPGSGVWGSAARLQRASELRARSLEACLSGDSCHALALCTVAAPWLLWQSEASIGDIDDP